MQLNQIIDKSFRYSISLLIFYVFVLLITEKSVEIFNDCCGFLSLLFPVLEIFSFFFYFKILLLSVYIFRIFMVFLVS